MKNTNQNSNGKPRASNTRFWLLGILGIGSLLVVLQSLGIAKSIGRAHTEGWIDMKSNEYQNRPMPQRVAEKLRPEVDATLGEIATEFEGKVFDNISTANHEKGWGLTDDEAKYYDAVRQRYNGAPQNWLGLVKKSYSTYRAVKETFGGSADVASMLKDGQSAMNIYGKLNEIFGISPSESDNFAKSGRAHNLSDWAYFVESRKK